MKLIIKVKQTERERENANRKNTNNFEMDHYAMCVCGVHTLCHVNVPVGMISMATLNIQTDIVFTAIALNWHTGELCGRNFFIFILNCIIFIFSHLNDQLLC